MARILIVDDELNLLKAMQKVLVEASHNVEVVSDAQVLIEGSLGTDFDLVVTDMIMPNADGLEVLSYLYRANPRIKIVAISGGGYFASDFHLNLAAKFGAVTTLEKPFLLSELVKTVEDILSRNPDSPNSGGTNPAGKAKSGAGPHDRPLGCAKVVDPGGHKGRDKSRRQARPRPRDPRNARFMRGDGRSPVLVPLCGFAGPGFR